MKSKADRGSPENKTRNAVGFSFSCVFFSLLRCIDPLRSFWKAPILPKVDGGHHLISLMSGFFSFFLSCSCFSERSCARSLPCGVMRAKLRRQPRGQRLGGGGGGEGGQSLKTVTGLKWRLILTLLYLARQGPKHLVCVCEPISSWSGNEPVRKMLSKSSHTPVASLELLFFFHPGLFFQNVFFSKEKNEQLIFISSHFPNNGLKINLKKYFFFLVKVSFGTVVDV